MWLVIGPQKNGVLLGVEWGPSHVQSVHLWVWQASHRLEHQHPCTVTRKIRCCHYMPWTCDWSRLSHTNQPFLWELDPEKGDLYMSFSHCTQLAWNVQNCGFVFYPSCLCWHPLVSGNGAPSCNTWHLTDVRRASHLCEFNVNLCITVSISLWHFWNNPTYLPCPGETAELCLPWLMNGRISKKSYVYFLMKL